jgi:fructokinase
MPTAMRKTDRSPGPFYGGVDAGGTKFLCAIGKSHNEIEKITSIKTTSEEQTLAAVASFFNEWLAEGNALAGLGISSFGPLIRDSNSPDYGKLCNSPKRGWAHADIGGFLCRNVPVPVKIDTDVNGAALAEGRWGAARGKSHFAYVTVGTGIGVGIVADGRLVNGVMHPELGHYRPPRHPNDAFTGNCPFHGDCLEGLASGPALQARLKGGLPEGSNDENAIWQFAVHYLAHLCSLLLLTCAPECIILGGGVMQRTTLFAKIRQATRSMLGGYLSHPLHAGNLENIIVPSGLTTRQDGQAAINAGVIGGFVLAEQAAQSFQD